MQKIIYFITNLMTISIKFQKLVFYVSTYNLGQIVKLDLLIKILIIFSSFSPKNFF